jgi:hypothetical protein
MLLSASPDRSAILRRVIGLFIVRSKVTRQLRPARRRNRRQAGLPTGTAPEDVFSGVRPPFVAVIASVLGCSTPWKTVKTIELDVLRDNIIGVDVRYLHGWFFMLGLTE